MPPTLHVVLNPGASRGRGARALPEIRRALAEAGISHEVHTTAGPGDATRVARDLAREGAAQVVAAGGDGTIHEVVNGLLAGADDADRRPELGVLPLGTGNDFARLLGARGLPAALRRLASGRTATFDVGVAAWAGAREWFANGMGTGVDVEVVDRLASGPRLPGLAAYLWAAVRALISYEPRELTIALDGDGMRLRTLILAVGNGVCQGGGFNFWPESDPADGLLSACIVEEMGMARVAATLPAVLRGTHAGRRGVWLRSVRELRIVASAAPLRFQLDGELRELPAGSELAVGVEPAALRVRVD